VVAPGDCAERVSTHDVESDTKQTLNIDRSGLTINGMTSSGNVIGSDPVVSAKNPNTGLVKCSSVDNPRSGRHTRPANGAEANNATTQAELTHTDIIKSGPDRN
jgi:hypothetical protein